MTYVGIDVSKLTFVVAYSSAKSSKTIITPAEGAPCGKGLSSQARRVFIIHMHKHTYNC